MYASKKGWTQRLRASWLGRRRDRCAPCAAQVRWFELPPVMIFHVANAWQEGEHTVKLFACCFTDVRPPARAALAAAGAWRMPCCV